MEIAINTLAINTLTSGDRQTCNEKLNNTLTEVDLTSRTNQTCQQKLENSLTDIRTHSTSGTSQTCNEKLYALTECSPHHQTSGTSQTCNEKLYALTECSPYLTSGTSQTCNEKLYALTECSPHHQTSGTSQTCNEKLYALTECSPYLTSGTSQTWKQKLQRRRRTWKPKSTQVGEIAALQTTEGEKGYMFSVSLQMTKAASKSNALRLQIPSSLDVKMKLSNSPPLSSKLRKNDEDYEEFFQENIAFYLEHMKKHYGYTEATDDLSQTNHMSQFTSTENQSQVQLPFPADALQDQNTTHFLDQRQYFTRTLKVFVTKSID
ncbi:hypothetical protein J6590_045072 [Homalodisca vitripennis]|nr:hypothetical protein J6590_045072 [Homalodisca vitripennis]